MPTGKQVVGEWLIDNLGSAAIVLTLAGYIVRLAFKIGKMEARLEALERAKEAG